MLHDICTFIFDFFRRDAIGSELFNSGIVIPSRGGWTCSGICVMRIFAVINDLVEVNFSPRFSDKRIRFKAQKEEPLELMAACKETSSTFNFELGEKLAETKGS